jgi:hypothetical protein
MPPPFATLDSLARALAQTNAERRARLDTALVLATANASHAAARLAWDLDERKLDVFAGSPKAHRTPIFCYTCRARYSSDCECTADDLDASAEEGRCSRLGIDP